MSESRTPGRGRSASVQRIPRVLHFVWVGPPMPTHLAGNITTWRELHPSWLIRVWTERDLGWMTNRRLFSEAESIVPRDAVGQFRADLARYEILLQYGGFYADVDTYPVRSIDDSILNHREFAVQEDHNWIGNTYLGAVSDHPIMRTIVAGIPANARRMRGRRPNVIAGPKYITGIWRNHSGYVAPTEWGFPYSYTDVGRGTVPDTIGTGTYVVHQWHHTRQLTEARNAQR